MLDRHFQTFIEEMIISLDILAARENTLMMAARDLLLSDEDITYDNIERRARGKRWSTVPRSRYIVNTPYTCFAQKRSEARRCSIERLSWNKDQYLPYEAAASMET